MLKIVHFHVPDHIYLAFFCDELIALDLKKNKYMILSEELSQVLIFALVNEFKKQSGKYLLPKSGVIFPEKFGVLIEHLKKYGLLCERANEYPIKKIPQHKISAGADNVDWRMLPEELNKKVSKILILEAYISLLKVYFLLRILGFSSLIHTIRKKANKCVNKDSKAFSDLVTALNQACFFFPVKTKCLEWSATLVLMGMRRQLACNLEIGVQNSPFLAHAWVKVGKDVIADEGNLPKMLSVILSEPFS